MRVSSVGYLVKQGATSVWKNRMMSFASFCILLVSLMLVGFSVLAGINISSIVSGIEDKNEIVVILHDKISDEQIDSLYVKLKELSNVSDVSFYSKEEAWESIVEGMTEEEDSVDSESLVVSIIFFSLYFAILVFAINKARKSGKGGRSGGGGSTIRMPPPTFTSSSSFGSTSFSTRSGLGGGFSSGGGSFGGGFSGGGGSFGGGGASGKW